MTMWIRPDTAGPPITLLGPGWLRETAELWRVACATRETHVSIDLSTIRFIRLLVSRAVSSFLSRNRQFGRVARSAF